MPGSRSRANAARRQRKSYVWQTEEPVKVRILNYRYAPTEYICIETNYCYYRILVAYVRVGKGNFILLDV